MRECINVMKALSDPNRVKMIKLLQRRILYVCNIQRATGLAQSSVSKHLKILRDAGLIILYLPQQMFLGFIYRHMVQYN
ncbi:transcriptional regulator [Desulfococcus multivorans]|uniref:Transcriptional regulator, ArsR family n=3 Tax=Desulfococcaceae TaxID=2931039 RepID=S7ULJ0_DESML|nr:transcriptional regulator [Desulfococcus multivorans]EPR33208.1 transcriptional regulator, ArsR family [Desulfococcus multivorans DSM 2059]SKA23787.1 regulatory protein, arsR family [Desulfococcus multivorans DSM 2059]